MCLDLRNEFLFKMPISARHLYNKTLVLKSSFEMHKVRNEYQVKFPNSTVVVENLPITYLYFKRIPS